MKRTGEMPKSKTIWTRTILGAVMIAGVCGLLALDWYLQRRWGSGTVLVWAIALLAAAGFREIGRLAEVSGPGVLGLSGLAGTVLLAAAPRWLRPQLTAQAVLVLLLAVAAGAFLEQMIRHRTDRAVGRLAATFLGLLYVGAGAAMILAVRMSFGVAPLVLFLAAVKFTDIGAYFTGTAIGRHKLIAWLSPGKSWEGLAGGLAAGACVSMLAAWAFGLPLAIWQAAVFGVLVGLAGQFADLCESLLKRSASVKDSGSVLPEFGGVLDMLDSPLLSAPLAYVLLGAMM